MKHDPRSGRRLICDQRRPPDPDPYPELHAEIERLPEKYRVPIVLCYFEGLTHEQAASRLRWPLGTVKIRLSRARERLRSRLEQRGQPPLLLIPATAFRPGQLAELPERSRQRDHPGGMPVCDDRRCRRVDFLEQSSGSLRGS